MTQQFKFGDMVRFTLTNPTETVEAIYLHEHVTDDSVAVLVTSKGFNINMPRVRLQLIPHPDTKRLDWLIKQNFNFQKCYDMSGRWWYEDNSFDKFKGTEGLDEREAIDAAMHQEAV